MAHQKAWPCSLRELLWKHKREFGFEGALGELQMEHNRSPNAATRARLKQMEEAVGQMFAAMEAGFASVPFEFQEDPKRTVKSFLMRFDAIFTLNQDLLLERHYLNNLIGASFPRRWKGWQIFGMRPENTELADMAGGPGYKNLGTWVGGGHPTIQDGLQPYVKLHGSSNWRGTNDVRIMAVGAQKRGAILHFQVLGKLHETFKRYLTEGPVRLMVIGYSFSDEHINDVIALAAAAGHLELFVIDPLGTDVLDKNRLLPIYSPGPLFSQLRPSVIGASRRSLREIFGSDHVEHAKVMSFLQ